MVSPGLLAAFVALLVVSLLGLLRERRAEADADGTGAGADGHGARGPTRWTLAFKAAASSTFLGLSLASTPAHDGYGLAVRVAFVASFLGDIALVGSSRRHVAAGMGLFFLAHVAFAAGFYAVLTERHTLGEALPALIGCTVPTLIGSGLTVRWSWAGMGPLRPAGAVYGVAVAATGGLALALAVLAPRAPGAVVVGLGGLLFFVSDIAVARQRFVKEAWINRALGLPAYYGGQLLLATSVGLVGAA